MKPRFKYAAFALLLLSPAYAHAETTVALTTTVHAQAAAAEKQLAANLLALLEVETNQFPEIQVVERQQLDLALHELVLSSSRSDEATLQLGNLAKADLILTAKLLEPDKTGRQQVLVRITQAATAVIRGVTAVPISSAQIEDAAAEIADYLATTTKGPKSQLPTVAVMPFESIERFDRLRPLERGLRDLFTSALLRQKTCRVVQRSSMEQLLTELDLVRSGLTSGGRGLEDAPAREAAFVLRGKIDEKIDTTGSLLLLKVEVVNAKSQKIAAKIEKSCQRQNLADSVAEIAAEILQHTSDGKQHPKPVSAEGKREIDRLFEMAAQDVFRFIRKCPDDDGHYPLNVPGLGWQGWRGNITADSDLGKHLLKKSIDRLESVLFINPDRQRAAMLLAYCLSFHVEGVWRSEQCESLLRRLSADSRNVKLQKMAFQLLADMYFRHQGGLHGWHEISKVDPALLTRACEHRLEVFANTPKHLRDSRWVRLLRIFVAVCDDPQYQQASDQRLQQKILTTIKKVADQPENKQLSQKTRDYLTKEIASIAKRIIQNRKNEPSLKKEAVQLLRRWTSDQDPRRRIVSAKTLYYFGKIPLEDCHSIIQSVISDKNSAIPAKGWIRDILWLSENLLKSNEPEVALSLLKKFKPKRNEQQYYHAPHQYGFTLGQCYEQLGRQEDALHTYMKYIELPAHYGSGLGFESRIRELGGVPISKSRDIEVRYPEIEPGKTLHCRILATDGNYLYCVSGFERKRRGDPIRKIRVLDLDSETWSTIDGPDDRITDLALSKGFLWAGTQNKGLWRISLPSGTWEHWTTDDGLPLNSVLSIVVHGQVAFVSIGNVNSHGHILSGAATRCTIEPITSKVTVEIYRDKQAPQIAPASMTLDNDRLIASGQHGKIHALDLKSNKWSKIPRVSSSLVEAGPSGVWTVPRGSIASLLGASEAERKKFPAQGRLKYYPAGTYLPRFIVEHEGSLWIGGEPWRKFGDTGLFRLDLATGKFKRYGAREGFRYAEHNDYECYDGVWAKDRLWVATSFGLAEVAMRDPTEQDRKTPIEEFAETIKPLLPEGWQVSVAGKSITLRRNEKVLSVPLYGRPARNANETESEYLRRIGAQITLDLELRFRPRMTTAEYKKLSGIHSAVMQQGKNGFHGKAGLSRHFRLLERLKLPTYFTADHTIFVDGVPPQYTMHDDAAHREMKEIFVKLNTLLELYEGAKPLPYSQNPSKEEQSTKPRRSLVEALDAKDRLDEKGFSQLHRAASSGNVRFAQALIDRGANVDIPQRTFHGTPLQYAASSGQVEMVELLLKHKGNRSRVQSVVRPNANVVILP